MIQIRYYSCPEYLRRRGFLIDGDSSPPEVRHWTVDEIQRRVAEHYGIPPRIMRDGSRWRVHARPRQVAVYLCRRFTTQTLPELGRRFGNRDHTTIMYSVKRIEELRLSDPEVAVSVDYLAGELGGA